MKIVLPVALGGVSGSAARFGVSQLVLATMAPWIQLATLAVNLLGSFAIRFIPGAVASGAGLSADHRLFLTTGVLGEFTTYSTFHDETVEWLRGGRPGTALAYVAATGIGCLAAGFAGAAAAAKWAPLR
jgi:CrcB protein